jgi:phage baseplate assembly protein W
MPFKNTIINKSSPVTQTLTKTSQFYKGFSTINNTDGNTTLYDFALVKQDIINHFNTKKGERLMNPEFGSSIWDLLMEPITDDTRQALAEDIESICN